MKSYIVIKKNGLLETFEGDFQGLPLRSAKIKRASYIYPQNFFLFILFKILRFLFGDKGKVADWTRTWRVKWYVYFPSTGEKYYNFSDRKKAIEFERQYIYSLKIARGLK